MITWLHHNDPSPILGTIGPITIYWYGALYFVSILLAYFFVRHRLRQISQPHAQALRDNLVDFGFGLVVSGLLGARLYHVLNEPLYYLTNPLKSMAVWEGGLAIHGGLVGGALFSLWYARKCGVSFLWLADLIAPALLLAQSIGRWGNYFNQELFGKPTGLAWGIPIDEAHRPFAYAQYEYFHPTFLYESLWDFLGLLLILFCERRWKLPRGSVFALYLVTVGLGRFLVELLRIDSVPMIGIARLPHVIASLVVIVGITITYKAKKI